MAAEYMVRPRTMKIRDGARDLLTEAELSRIWAAQSFPPEALTLVDGRRLRIVLPGRPGGSRGPDYRDAVVAIDGVEQRGDLELHVRAPSFYDHGHHEDAAYDNLVLHVVFAADGDLDTRLHSGRTVPVAAFAPWVGNRSQQLEEWLTAPPLWREPCSGATARVGETGVRAVLDAEGRRRFARKKARLVEAVAAAGIEQALWQGLLDNFGSGSRDRAAWRRLADVLPATRLRGLFAGHEPRKREAVISIALLATAGLASPPDDLMIILPRPLNPSLSGGSRPASRPERRLRALAILWCRLQERGGTGVREATTINNLVAAWTVADPLGGPALLGVERARELLLNVVLPLAAIDPELAEKAEAFASKLPAASGYGRTAFLEANLGRPGAGFRPKTALQQQGLLAMTADWCRQGGCGRCPLS